MQFINGLCPKCAQPGPSASAKVRRVSANACLGAIQFRCWQGKFRFGRPSAGLGGNADHLGEVGLSHLAEQKGLCAALLRMHCDAPHTRHFGEWPNPPPARAAHWCMYGPCACE